MENKELLDKFQDIAEVVILNIREDNEAEFKELHSKIDKLIDILTKLL